MNVLKRMHLFFLGLVAILFAFPALAADPAKVRTLYQGGAITVVKGPEAKSLAGAKLTTVSALTCYAVNVGQRYFETPTAGPVKYIFAVPASCTTNPNTGIWFNGAIERIDQVGTASTLAFYEVTPMQNEPFTIPQIAYARVGEEVFVTASESMEMKIGVDVITTYSYDTFIQANIAGTVAGGSRTNRTCSATGCVVGSESLSWGFVVLDKGIVVPPGTAMMDIRGNVVGIVIGNDKNMSLAVTVDGINNAAYQIGINLGGKG